MKLKASFSESINKIDKPRARLKKKKMAHTIQLERKKKVQLTFQKCKGP